MAVVSTKRKPGPNVVLMAKLLELADLEKLSKDKPWKLEITTLSGSTFFRRFADAETANAKATKILSLGHALEVKTAVADRDGGRPSFVYWPIAQIQKLSIFKDEVKA